MNLYATIIEVYPAEEGQVKFFLVETADKNSSKETYQLATDPSVKFKKGETFSADVERAGDNQGTPIFKLKRVKKRYETKKSSANPGMLVGHASTCAQIWGAEPKGLLEKAKEFHDLTNQIKEDYASQIGVDSNDYNTGATVGHAVKMACEYAKQSPMDRVEKAAWWYLNQIEPKLKEYVG